MDREKTIKGLECHKIDINHRINCADCPYYVDDDNHIRCVNDLHDDTLSLLQEQEAAYQGAVELLRQKTILFDDAIKKLKEQQEEIENLKQTAQSMMEGVCLLKEQDNCENCAIAIEDRQPVVRCKDCRHCTFFDGEQLADCMIKQGWFPVKQDWFCADGERKEGR